MSVRWQARLHWSPVPAAASGKRLHLGSPPTVRSLRSARAFHAAEGAARAVVDEIIAAGGMAFALRADSVCAERLLRRSPQGSPRS